MSVNKEPVLIYHQGVICGVAVPPQAGKPSLRRIIYTPQSSIFGALHLTPCWCPGIPKLSGSKFRVQGSKVTTEGMNIQFSPRCELPTITH
jgi:hypothetical protein